MAKLPTCMAPGCRKCGSHGAIADADTLWRWCTDHKEQHHVLLIKP